MRSTRRRRRRRRRISLEWRCQWASSCCASPSDRPRVSGFGKRGARLKASSRALDDRRTTQLTTLALELGLALHAVDLLGVRCVPRHPHRLATSTGSLLNGLRRLPRMGVLTTTTQPRTAVPRRSGHHPTKMASRWSRAWRAWRAWQGTTRSASRACVHRRRSSSPAGGTWWRDVARYQSYLDGPHQRVGVSPRRRPAHPMSRRTRGAVARHRRTRTHPARGRTPPRVRRRPMWNPAVTRGQQESGHCNPRHRRFRSRRRSRQVS